MLNDIEEKDLNEESQKLLDIYEMGRKDALNTMVNAMEEFCPAFIGVYYDEEEEKLNISGEKNDLSIKERLIFESFEEYFKKVLELSNCDKCECMWWLKESEE